MVRCMRYLLYWPVIRPSTMLSITAVAPYSMEPVPTRISTEVKIFQALPGSPATSSRKPTVEIVMIVW